MTDDPLADPPFQQALLELRATQFARDAGPA